MKKNWKEFHSTIRRTRCWRYLQNPFSIRNTKTKGLILLLDTIQDPGNLGTIIRTADWFGIKQVICSPETVDVFNQKVVQSAMGSLIRVEVIYT